MGKSEILVSICIPAYNNADHITETIESVLKQSHQRIEIIVVDDASLDNTYDVVAALTDSRIRLYKNEKNLGMAGNWNRTLELAQGEFIKVMGADDLLKKTAIEKELAVLLANPSAVTAESDTAMVDMQGKTRGTQKRYRKSGLMDGKVLAKKCLLSQDRFGAPVANLIRKSVLEMAGGFDPDFVYIIDYDFFLNLACKGDVFILHEALNGFRLRTDSNTGQVMGGGKSKAYIAEHRQLLDKYREVLQLSASDVTRSMCMRRLWSFAVSVYLRFFGRGKG
ncbi:glycosyl hydrolase [Clostridia bacterium]|nr:glycosyl hydrolase [Clostridia bacterium]